MSGSLLCFLYSTCTDSRHTVFQLSTRTITREESSRRRAITAPRIRKAVGSPEQLFCRHTTLVPSIRPRSLRRLRKLPSISSSSMRHCCPSLRVLRSEILFIYKAPYNYSKYTVAVLYYNMKNSMLRCRKRL